VAVAPGWEGRGVGTELIETLLDSARGRFPGIVLSSRAENPAVRLYRRLGFEPVGEMTNRVGTTSVKMLASL
jgi:ribosomal protein S18 acetylase RimI-like enzyme